jgi:CheY-like chemotaxis protein
VIYGDRVIDPLVPEGPGSAVRGRVLVVDDEADQRCMLRRCFERAGYQVSEAGDGDAALHSVERARPDLVVTDVMMPVMAGPELIRRLRAAERTAGIPILAVTGDGGLASDADAVLAKPYDRKELIMVAEGLIGERRGVS